MPPQAMCWEWEIWIVGSKMHTCCLAARSTSFAAAAAALASLLCASTASSSSGLSALTSMPSFLMWLSVTLLEIFAWQRTHVSRGHCANEISAGSW